MRNPVDVNLEALSFMYCDFMFFHSAFEPLVPKLRAGIPRTSRFVCIDRASEFGPSLQEWTGAFTAPYRAAAENPLDAAFIQPTGTTTGPSKAAVHTHRSLEMMFIASGENFRYTSESRTLAVAPLTHAGGIDALATLSCGGSVVVMNMTSPDQVLDVIEASKITHVFLPPTLRYLPIDTLQRHPRDMSSLVQFTTGAAPVAPDKIKQATRVFGPVMAEGFGQTECGMHLLWKQPEDYLAADGRFDDAALAFTGRASGVRCEHRSMQDRARMGDPYPYARHRLADGMLFRQPPPWSALLNSACSLCLVPQQRDHEPRISALLT